MGGALLRAVDFFISSPTLTGTLAENGIKGVSMNANYTAIVKKDGDDWIGWVEEVPGVNAQEKTKARLLKSLRIILKEALEFNRAEAREAAVADYSEELLTV